MSVCLKVCILHFQPAKLLQMGILAVSMQLLYTQSLVFYLGKTQDTRHGVDIAKGFK